MVELALLIKHHPIKMFGEVEIYITSAVAGGEWSASRPGRFTPGEKARDTLWIGGWVDPRAGMDDLEKRKFLALPGLELQPLSRPARSQPLYRLYYTGSSYKIRGSKYILTGNGAEEEEHNQLLNMDDSGPSR
jgi:hypothetical protein